MAMPKTRINLRPMVMALLLGVVLPISIALLIDLKLGTWPVATIVTIIIFMPLGAIWLNRVMLDEFDQVVEEVAPALPDSVDEPVAGTQSINQDQ